jgi:hypothetical protein
MKIEENYKRRIKTLHFVTVVTCKVRIRHDLLIRKEFLKCALVVMHSNDTKTIFNNKEKQFDLN